MVSVPYWFPNSRASLNVLRGMHPKVNAVFPVVTYIVADTFAALWDPRDKDSVYRMPEAAYAAAAALAELSLVTG